MTMGDKIVLRLNKDLWNKITVTNVLQTSTDSNGTDLPATDDGKMKRYRSLSVSKLPSPGRPPKHTPRNGNLTPKTVKSVQIIQPSLIDMDNLTWSSITEDSEEVIERLNFLYTQLKSDVHDIFEDTTAYEREMSGISNMNFGEVVRHLVSLRIEHIQQLFRPILQKLIYHPRNLNLFNQPVDYIALDIPDYPLRISKPMDLGTMKSRLQRGEYLKTSDVISDMKLVFKNAMQYNPPSHSVYEIAKFISDELEAELQTRLEHYAKDYERRRSHTCSLCQGACCVLCGEKCLKFEPLVLVCFGSCGQRIKRNSTYYVSVDGARHWCQKCYSALPIVVLETRNSTPLMKKDLLRRRSDEEVAEPWVQCDTCSSWVHQVCSLYNSSMAPLERESAGLGGFDCPSCKVMVMKSLCQPVSEKGSQASHGYGTRKRGHMVRASPRSRSQSLGAVREETGANPVGEMGGQYSTRDKRKCEFQASNGLNHYSHGNSGHSNSDGDSATTTDSELDHEADVSVDAHKRGTEEDMNMVEANEESTVNEAEYHTGSEDSGDERQSLSNSDDISKSQSVFESDQQNRELKPLDANSTTTNVDIDVISLSDLAPLQGLGIKCDHTVEDGTMMIKEYSPTPRSNKCASPSSPHKSQLQEALQEKTRSPHQLPDGDRPDATLENAHLNGHRAEASCEDDFKMDSAVADVEKSTEKTVAFCVDGLSVGYLGANSSSCSSSSSSSSLSDSSDTFRHIHNSHSKMGLVELKEKKRPASQWTASELPRTKLSDFLEAMVSSRLASMGFEDTIDSICVRMVSNVDQYMEVPHVITENMMTANGKKVPLYLPYRQKCILLFQNIDGVDVCLFCLYAQEFNDSCPEPNRSKVYIAYLDSVEYFRPMEARTMVYHEIMVGYLQWVQARGFEQGHIWSCPPQRGDNFIFWCHPNYQRTPSRDRLCAWYSGMLRRATSLGVIKETSNLWSGYFSSYMKREKDETQQRQASKNSYVGHFRAHNKSLQAHASLPNLTALTAAINFNGAKSHSHSASAATATAQVPICPPVFEGDFWVNECIRVHRVVQGRAKSSDIVGGDKMNNYRVARDMIKHLMSRPRAPPFCTPVDHVLLNIPLYPSIVKQPMDLRTVQEKIRGNSYITLLDFAKDVRLTFNNAMLFNPPSHPIHVSACELFNEFQQASLDLVSDRVGEIADVDNMDSYLASYQLRGTPSVIASPVPAEPRGKNAEALTSIKQSKSLAIETDLWRETLHQGPSTVPLMSQSGSAMWQGPLSMPVLRRTCSESDAYLTSDSASAIVEDANILSAAGATTTELQESNISTLSDATDRHSSRIEVRGPSISVDGESERQMYRSSFDDSAVMETGSGVESDSDEDAVESVDVDTSRDDMSDSHSEHSGGTALVSRQDSNESINSMFSADDRRSGVGSLNNSSSGGQCEGDWGMRQVSISRSFNGPVPSDSGTNEEPFEKPQLGYRGSMSLMSELSKGVQRLKDDLFIISFAKPGLRERRLKKSRKDYTELPMGSGSVSDSESSNTAGLATKKPASAGLPVAAYGSFRPMVACGRGKGRPPAHLKTDVAFASEELPEMCADLLDENIQCADTSDPDEAMQSPFVDTRHTFLEMCQFKHLQFDSLRRAKHSSLILLYHLHNPYADHLRPICSVCSCVITEVRWHCMECESFDICGQCFNSKRKHVHELTPVRVTFV